MKKALKKFFMCVCMVSFVCSVEAKQKRKSEDNLEIKPNTVIAHIKAKNSKTDIKVTVQDVLMFAQEQIPNLASIDKEDFLRIFPEIRDMLVRQYIMLLEAEESKFLETEEGKKALVLAKLRALPPLFSAHLVKKSKLIDENTKDPMNSPYINKKYEEFLKTFKPGTQMSLKVVVFDNESDAKNAIKKLAEGKSFSSLSDSVISTGYFDNDILESKKPLSNFNRLKMMNNKSGAGIVLDPAIINVANNLEVGKHNSAPIHVKVQGQKKDAGASSIYVVVMKDKADRQAPKPQKEDLMFFFVADLQRHVEDQVICRWKDSVKRFDLDGKDVLSCLDARGSLLSEKIDDSIASNDDEENDESSKAKDDEDLKKKSKTSEATKEESAEKKTKAS